MAPNELDITKVDTGTSASAETKPILELCSDGDLTLFVGEDLGPVHRFRVSRSTLCMASPVWRAMLKGQFSESVEKNVSFPDDVPNALLVVLNIAHLRFNKVPREVSYVQLVSMATICDKYDTVAICRPFIQDWVQLWLLNQKASLLQNNEHWLWIFWVFGYEAEFCELVDDLRHRVYTDSKGRCITQTGRYLDGPMPPGLVG